jgi:hypothetical protein
MKKTINQTATKPLVIFIGEQHDNMAYGSLMEKLIKYSEARGLKVQIFSEYESQTGKIKLENQLQEPLRNAPDDPKIFEETTKFLDSRFVKMGDLDEREKIMTESLERYQQQGLTPRQLYEQTKPQMVVAPEIYGWMEGQLQEGEKTGFLGKGTTFEKPFTLENFYHDFRAQFNHEAVHGRMLEDLRSTKKDDTDVVIIVTGFGHTYGLDKELESDFDGCDKFVITNFLDNRITDPTERSKIKNADSSAQIGIGGLLEFDVDQTTKSAFIPDIVTEKLDEKARDKIKSLNSDLKKTEQMSFVERVQASNIEGKSGNEL